MTEPVDLERLQEDLSKWQDLYDASYDQVVHLEDLLDKVHEIYGRCRTALAELTAARKVVDAAKAVIWFDWSGNDEDAVQAIEELRAAIAADQRPTAHTDGDSPDQA